ncbi:DUF3823 domain-containing protein [Flavobacterium sp. TSSA_36]|jgi:hypothetical protein|uniref:DUF3823 domain-containing protein n=1 Tax=Flavobacterium sp. TSSA_36 TaxID=3447669 RepID=UPI003F34862D
MNKYLRIITLLLVFQGFTSCELDNLKEPTSGLYGKIIDEKTGELVPQDIIQGSIIELRENGYVNVAPQNLVVKNSGNYENSRLFANKYMVQPVRTNFQTVAAQEVLIEGRTNLDFTVKPFLRLNEAKIEQVGTKIVASFKMEQTTADVVKKYGLYAHRDPNVGEFMQTARTEITLNALAVADKIYTVEIETLNNASFVKGKTYYFRVGAVTVAPESRSNYAPTVVSFTL